MTLAQIFNLEVDGVSANLRVTRVHGRERIHAPWAFEVVCSAEVRGARVELTPADLVTKNAELAWDIGGGGRRTVAGLVESIEAAGTEYHVTLAPKVALLGDAVDHRVFVDATALEIATEILSEHGFSIDARVARTLSKRTQCIQVFESNLAFVSRLFAEEGLAWFLPLGKGDVLAVVDHPSGFQDTPDVSSLPVVEGAGLVAAESVFAARVRRALVSDKVTFRDYNFEKPMLDQTASAQAESGRRERYEYPGRYADPRVGGTLAQIRLDQLRSRRLVLDAETTCRKLAPGYVVTLSDAARADMNGRWLVLEVSHEAFDYDAGRSGEDRYVARVIAVPAAQGHRPERPATPQLGGVQTVTVSGPSGAEIHTEQYGRVIVHHRWDRRRPTDAKASAPVRVVQPPTSGGFLLPRTGWEALVAFSMRSADTPVVLGRLYNGQAPPPSGLPGKKVVSAFGTQTTPGGGSANVIAMDDTAGSEGMNFTASNDFNERTENTKNTKIAANDTWTVGADRTLIVGKVLSVKVAAAQSYTIGATRTVSTTSNKMISAASETVMVAGLRTFNVGGDYVTGCASLTRLVGGARMETAIEHSDRAVKGAQTVLVGGSWNTVAGASANVAVTGASTELVGGAKSIKASTYYLSVKGALNETLASRSVNAAADREEGFGAAASYAIGGAATIQGSDVTVSAKANLIINAGGVTIRMTPASITISGDFKSSVDCEDSGNVDYE